MTQKSMPTAINWTFYQDANGAFNPAFGFRPFIPIGNHVAVNLTTNVLSLTPPDGAIEVLIQVLYVNCRMTLDGSTPSASVGFQLLADDSPLIVSISPVTRIKLIGENTGAEVQYQFGR